jgi:hypothetical protein
VNAIEAKWQAVAPSSPRADLHVFKFQFVPCICNHLSLHLQPRVQTIVSSDPAPCNGVAKHIFSVEPTSVIKYFETPREGDGSRHHLVPSGGA